MENNEKNKNMKIVDTSGPQKDKQKWIWLFRLLIDTWGPWGPGTLEPRKTDNKEQTRKTKEAEENQENQREARKQPARTTNCNLWRSSMTG